MQIYLYINAALYALFAVWCTVLPSKTAENLGYLSLSNGGRSEYLVIYGGLQIGLAIMFFAAGRSPQFQRFGMIVALGFYAPIVLYRVITVIRHWPVATLTVATGCLEAALLVAGAFIYSKVA